MDASTWIGTLEVVLDFLNPWNSNALRGMVWQTFRERYVLQ